MNIDKNNLVCGYTAYEIRRLMRDIREYSCYLKRISFLLDISKNEAEKLAKKLVKEGYLKVDERIGDISYSITIKGNSFAMASFAKPITRKTATKKVEELLVRVKEVNNCDDFLFKVKQVAIFGSYLSDKEKLGDIDVNIIMEEKFSKDIQKKKGENQINKAYKEGKVFNSFIDQLFYPLNKTCKFIKCKSKALSLHYDDPIAKQVELKVIYEAD